MLATTEKAALSAVQSLCALQTVVDEGDPTRAGVAQDALELATERLAEVGMLDIMISIAARQQTAKLDLIP